MASLLRAGSYPVDVASFLLAEDDCAVPAPGGGEVDEGEETAWAAGALAQPVGCSGGSSLVQALRPGAARFTCGGAPLQPQLGEASSRDAGLFVSLGDGGKAAGAAQVALPQQGAPQQSALSVSPFGAVVSDPAAGASDVGAYARVLLDDCRKAYGDTWRFTWVHLEPRSSCGGAAVPHAEGDWPASPANPGTAQPFILWVDQSFNGQAGFAEPGADVAGGQTGVRERSPAAPSPAAAADMACSSPHAPQPCCAAPAAAEASDAIAESMNNGLAAMAAAVEHVWQQARLSTAAAAATTAAADGAAAAAAAPATIRKRKSARAPAAAAVPARVKDEGHPPAAKRSKKGGAPRQYVGKARTGVTCLNCGATQTPQWREGPEGSRTLCNACGVRYKKGIPLAYMETKKRR